MKNIDCVSSIIGDEQRLVRQIIEVRGGDIIRTLRKDNRTFDNAIVRVEVGPVLLIVFCTDGSRQEMSFLRSSYRPYIKVIGRVTNWK